jgi:hypothetical protein
MVELLGDAHQLAPVVIVFGLDYAVCFRRREIGAEKLNAYVTESLATRHYRIAGTSWVSHCCLSLC